MAATGPQAAVKAGRKAGSRSIALFSFQKKLPPGGGRGEGARQLCRQFPGVGGRHGGRRERGCIGQHEGETQGGEGGKLYPGVKNACPLHATKTQL